MITFPVFDGQGNRTDAAVDISVGAGTHLLVTEDTTVTDLVLRPGDTVEFRNGARLTALHVDIQGTPTGTWTLDPGWVAAVDAGADPHDVIDYNTERDVNLYGEGHLFIPPEAEGPHIIAWARFDVRPGHELGHYPIHFHLNYDKSRGSVVEGVAVTGSTNRGIVTHGSHGITVRDCIVADVLGGAYGWDNRRVGDPKKAYHPDDSDDIVWERNLAVDFFNDPDFLFNREVFLLARGTGNVCRGCVSVNANGATSRNAGHFVWPEEGSGVWVFEDCAAIGGNCRGIFVWQNTYSDHVVERFTHRGPGVGIKHGAYTNNYRYIDVDVDTAEIWANVIDLDTMAGPRFQGGRIGDLLIKNGRGTGVNVLEGCGIGHTRVDIPDTARPHHVTFTDCLTWDDVTVEEIPPGSTITVDDETRRF